MTNKQFVQSLFPKTSARKLYGGGWIISGDIDINWRRTDYNSPVKSWDAAAKIINKRILDKLES